MYGQWGDTGLGGISLADAIARQENVDPKLNNPGALTAAPDSFCQTGKSGILVKFCTLEDGYAALNHQIELNVNRGMDLSSFFASYSPSAAGNDPINYTKNVASWTGIDPNTPLSMVDPGGLFRNYNSVDVYGGDGEYADLLGEDTWVGPNPVSWGLVALGLLAVVVLRKL